MSPTSSPARRPPRTAARDWLVPVFAAAGALMILFILLPLAATVASTSPQRVFEALLDSEVLTSLGLTFYAGAAATALALVTGVPLAYLLARSDFVGKEWIEGIVRLPVVVPHTAAGIALLLVFGRQGVLGKAFGAVGIGFTDALPGIVVGMLFVSLPFLVNASREAFALVDPDLEMVAATEGATRWQAFYHVTLPQAGRGILSGALLMWGRAISEFGAIVILAYHPRIVPILVYERFVGFGLSGAQPVAVLLLIASLVVFVLLQVLLRSEHGRAPRQRAG
jgi:molybdate/tungstate transport system permease protein